MENNKKQYISIDYITSKTSVGILITGNIVKKTINQNGIENVEKKSFEWSKEGFSSVWPYINSIIEEFIKKPLASKKIISSDEKYKKLVITAVDGSELSTILFDEEKHIDMIDANIENTEKNKDVVYSNPKTHTGVIKIIAGAAIVALALNGGITLIKSYRKHNESKGSKTDQPSIDTTSLEMAKKLATQAYGNPTQEQIIKIQNMILFMNHYPMPQDFDTLEDFFRPLTYLCGIDSIEANRKFVDGQELNDTRTPISIETIFTNKDDIAGVKFVSEKQQAIFNAIYEGKSKEEITALIKESIATLEKLLIDHEVINGIDASELSNEARLTMEYLYSTIISKMPTYSNIKNISARVKKDQEELMNDIEYEYNARRSTISLEGLENGTQNVYQYIHTL